jgi:hypothetical protein
MRPVGDIDLYLMRPVACDPDSEPWATQLADGSSDVSVWTSPT